ncbi:alpha-ribazole phosphatase [Alkalispirillum mobile]|uniref:Alpha-ribazole phosphatase n=1 Tax=Alkalispirillum mobile TaxID=85925 RepID=A0A498BX99_9GAMM|nr:histidine phosphatase family protein [Alkalispirillum mobile]RLK46976.1 alpha-ribazole phosphatase [Alkalispirillum mobile]
MNEHPLYVDLLRHGEPEGGRKYRGRLDDPLSETGWEQLRDAVSGGCRWDAVISSPLRRCAAFAREYSHRQGLPLHLESYFKEIDFGRWEGWRPEALMEAEGDRLNAFWRDPRNNPPPEGETLEALHARLARGWHRWVAEPPGQRLLVVCHGGVIRVLLAEALGGDPGHLLSRLQVPYACMTRLRVDRVGGEPVATLLAHGRPGV